jgi:hypothetical protein
MPATLTTAVPQQSGQGHTSVTLRSAQQEGYGVGAAEAVCDSSRQVFVEGQQARQGTPAQEGSWQTGR